VDQGLADAEPEEFERSAVAGGVMNPDSLRMDPKAVAFVKSFSPAASLWRPSATVHGPSWRAVRPKGAE